MTETLAERGRRARSAWTWTPERRAKASATRKRLLAAGLIAPPPASLGGKALKGRRRSTEANAKTGETQRRMHADGRLRISESHRAAVVASNKRRGIGEQNRLRVWTPEMRAKLGETRRRQYREGRITLSEDGRRRLVAAASKPHPWVSAALKGKPRTPEAMKNILAAVCMKPNGLERDVQNLLDQHCPGEWKFNVGEKIVAGKVPDFIRRDGVPVYLDMFGDYWHRNDNGKARQRLFARARARLVIVWEREFRRCPEIVVRRLASAMRRPPRG